MHELRELYQEVIVDHSRRPRNFSELSTANCQAEGFNRLCGDRLTLYLHLENDRIKDISFQGAGCAISTASASLLTEQLKGKTKQEAEVLFQQFHQLVTAKDDLGTQNNNLGKLVVLAGVREFPARVKCATLAWHTLQAALTNQLTATTETS